MRPERRMTDTRQGVPPAASAGPTPDSTREDGGTLGLSALFAVYFGVEPVVRTVLPVTGAEAYKYANFGFFKGVGRDFRATPVVTLKYDIGTVVGYWMLATFARHSA
jgi:hypothetical protein